MLVWPESQQSAPEAWVWEGAVGARCSSRPSGQGAGSIVDGPVLGMDLLPTDRWRRQARCEERLSWSVGFMLVRSTNESSPPNSLDR